MKNLSPEVLRPQCKDFHIQSTYISESASQMWVPKLLTPCVLFWFYSTQRSSCCAEAALLLGLKSDLPICVSGPAWKCWWGTREKLTFCVGNLCWPLLLGSMWRSCRSYLRTSYCQGGWPPADTMALDLLRRALMFPAVQQMRLAGEPWFMCLCYKKQMWSVRSGWLREGWRWVWYGFSRRQFQAIIISKTPDCASHMGCIVLLTD